MYDRLDECVYNIFRSVDRSDALTFAGTTFL